MIKDFLKGISFGLGILFVLSIVGLVSAVGFHYADEILPGTFSGDFIFNGNVNVSSDICIDGGNCLSSIDSSPSNEMQDLSNVLLQDNSAGSKRITNLQDPVDAQDAATKSYVDNNGGGTLNCVTKSQALSSTNTYAYYTTVACDTGYTVTGGGVRPGQWDTYRTSYSHPSGNGIYCYQQKDSTRGTCYARCCRIT